VIQGNANTASVVPAGGALIGANLPLGGGWNAGIDGVGGGADGDGGEYFDAWGGGSVHLFWRDPDYAVGIFGSGMDVHEFSGTDDGPLVAGGVEAAVFSPDSTFVVQAGYLSRISGVLGMGSDNDLISHGVAFRLENRWFLDDNTRLDAGIVGAYGNTGGDQEETGIGGVEIEIEHKLADSPLSFFVGGVAMAGTEADDSDFSEWDASIYYTAGVGIRFLFGHETLKSEDRNGPTFRSLPIKEFNAIASDQ